MSAGTRQAVGQLRAALAAGETFKQAERAAVLVRTKPRGPRMFMIRFGEFLAGLK